MSLFDDMSVYTRVAELASFTQAAQSLELPKASISTAVQRLEATLGTRLLHRTTRRVPSVASRRCTAVEMLAFGSSRLCAACVKLASSATRV